MPISVNENGVVKPLGSNILYERQIRYIPWHTTYQALTGKDCVVGNVDLFCTVDLSFTPDYVLVKRPVKNAIFWPNDYHNNNVTNNGWYYDGTSNGAYSDFHHTVVLTPVHSRHNMSEEEADYAFTFAYDVSNVSAATSQYSLVHTGFELVDSTVKCYFNISSSMRNTAPWITQGVGFGYDATQTRVLELDIEAFGNCQPTAV